MKKACLSLLLTLALCLSLAVPAFAAGGEGPLTLISPDDRYSVTFEAASVEQRTVQVTTVNQEDFSLEPYHSETVNLVHLRPGSRIIVNNGFSIGDVYGVPSGTGEVVDDDHYITHYSGDAFPTLCDGPVENSFNGNSLLTFYTNGMYYFLVIGPAEGTAGFTDVADTDYYAQPVLWAVDEGITNGTSPMTFSPNEPCTMAQIITFLYRSQGSPTPTISNPFGDVSAQDYFYDSSRWAAQKNLVSGSSFRGGSGCTRANVVLYLWTLAGQPATSGAVFSDVPTGSNLSQAVAWAASMDITNGTSPTTFSPNKVCTRGEIVTFLYRAYGW